MKINTQDIIVALATAHGSAAISIVRLSGPGCVPLVDQFFHTKTLAKKSLSASKPNYANFGLIVQQGVIIDEVLATVFKGPHSYTGQDSVEISCHGSLFIQQQLLQL